VLTDHVGDVATGVHLAELKRCRGMLARVIHTISRFRPTASPTAGSQSRLGLHSRELLPRSRVRLEDGPRPRWRQTRPSLGRPPESARKHALSCSLASRRAAARALSVRVGVLGNGPRRR
jgi:hypothetical protein